MTKKNMETIVSTLLELPVAEKIIRRRPREERPSLRYIGCRKINRRKKK
jgi:hypothetical protein